MQTTAFKLELLTPPQDDLLLRVKASSLSLKEGDCVAVSSKVVSIWQGRCVPRDRQSKEELIKQDADLYLDLPMKHGVIHTLKNGVLIANAGIDPLGDWYILLPEKPHDTAEKLLAWFKNEYRISDLKLIITDSRSVFLRQGAVGIAIAWAGFPPLYDNRRRVDLLGKDTGGTQTNLPDSLAAAATLAMGEANEQTPIAVMRGIPYLDSPKASPDSFEISPAEDLHAPLLQNPKWRKGGGGVVL